MWEAFIGGAQNASAGIANYLGQQEANDFNAAQNKANRDFAFHEADRNRKFQEKMSSSSYQRAMKDLQKAGLNPMLAYTQGGASTPAGSMASAPSNIAMENELGPAVNSAMEMRRLKKDIDQTDSAIMLNKAAEVDKKASAKLSEASAKVAEKNGKILDAQMPAIYQRARVDTAKGKIDERFVNEDAVLSRSHQASGILNNVMGSIRPNVNLNWKNGKGPTRGDMLIDKSGEIKREF